ncbi:D-alanyl-D-alanine carboxypeptidase [Streptomyces sp. NPDC049906]|uniref:D-alanyl-D-alanine carboxypeptidase n=1 Tax=Streptomyces sp. NPDC049906 TaxID=3155656 RepID=UPI00344AA843
MTAPGTGSVPAPSRERGAAPSPDRPPRSGEDASGADDAKDAKDADRVDEADEAADGGGAGDAEEPEKAAAPAEALDGARKAAAGSASPSGRERAESAAQGPTAGPEGAQEGDREPDDPSEAPEASPGSGPEPDSASAPPAGSARTATPDPERPEPSAKGDGPTEDGPAVAADRGAPVDGEGDPATEEPAAAPAAPADSDSDSDSDEETDEAEERPAVDQATAVFRTTTAPRVDQPTTTLSLAERPAGESGKAAGTEDIRETDGDDEGPPDRDDAGAPAERAQERTSKFVALKPLDEPASPRRPAAKPSWAAGADRPEVPDPRTDPGPGTGATAARPAPDGSAGETSALPAAQPERTTQQPLPPKPPLDLLAELTNTPPPPETPLRTAVRRVKIWTPLVLLLVIVFAVAQYLRPLPEPTLTLTAERTHSFAGKEVSLPWPAEGQGWMDVNGVGTMDRFGEQKPVPIGSVAKAMTAYVILKEHPMKPGSAGAKIPVDRTAEEEGRLDSVGESTLNTLKEGDEITQRDAIAAIMIPSANNIARLLARWDSSEKEFVEKMNRAAEDLGMKNTTYTDPSGLKEATVSTAEDQVKLGNELVRMKALTDITRLPEWTDQTGKKWMNYNRLVPFDGAIGIKTGTTTKAGGNLLFAGTKEVGGETAIVVGAILGQHRPPIIDTVNAVSKTAMIAAQGEVEAETILKKGTVVGHVDDGLGTRTPVVVTEDVSAVGFAGHTVRLELDAGDGLAHEAAAGTRVGTLKVGDGSTGAVSVPVTLQNAKTEPGFGAKVGRLG